MKRNAFIKHLKTNGCVLLREGANHSLYLNPNNGKKSIPSYSGVVTPHYPILCVKLFVSNLKFHLSDSRIKLQVVQTYKDANLPKLKSSLFRLFN